MIILAAMIGALINAPWWYWVIYGVVAFIKTITACYETFKEKL